MYRGVVNLYTFLHACAKRRTRDTDRGRDDRVREPTCGDVVAPYSDSEPERLLPIAHEDERDVSDVRSYDCSTFWAFNPC